MSSLAELKRKRGVVIDTMVFIYLFEAHPAYADLCETLVERMGQDFFSGVVTPITAAEILVKPLMQKRLSIADRYRMAIRSLPNVVLARIDEEIAFMAGALRAKYRMPLPDMLQAAVALSFPARTLITNDRVLRNVEEVRVLLLDEWAP